MFARNFNYTENARGAFDKSAMLQRACWMPGSLNAISIDRKIIQIDWKVNCMEVKVAYKFSTIIVVAIGFANIP